MTKSEDELYMMECLHLAARGDGHVSPNPLVGAVLVKNGKVIGRGYHRAFGGPHAEVHAIRGSTQSTRGATLYVNLEPCNHRGKTGPCTELIIRAGIRRVVMGMTDPNPDVRGNGAAALRRAGIRVDPGPLTRECGKLNERFVKFVTRRVPFVAVKVAQTLDGALVAANGKWITSLRSRRIVHELRSRYDAVLVGAGTVLADDPSLTVRHTRGRNPVRLILDGRLRTPLTATVYRTARTVPTIILASTAEMTRQARKVVRLNSLNVRLIGLRGGGSGRIPLPRILRAIAGLNIASVLVEGGAQVFNDFIARGVADKYYWFIAPKSSGILADGARIISQLEMKQVAQWNLGGDILVEGYPK